jgi:hypothetical protein
MAFSAFKALREVLAGRASFIGGRDFELVDHRG